MDDKLQLKKPIIGPVKDGRKEKQTMKAAGLFRQATEGKHEAIS